MKYSDSITEDGLAQEINRICGTTVNTYSFKSKAARLNAALDRYFSIGFEADGRWAFDDINQTSPPIDAQNLVSGTNRYKFGSFTEKIVDLIKLEVLDSSGKRRDLIPENTHDMGLPTMGNETGVLTGVAANTFEQLYIQAPSGTPTHYM